MKIDTQCIKTAQSQSVAEWGGIKKKRRKNIWMLCADFQVFAPKKKANERQEEVVESVVKIKGFV